MEECESLPSSDTSEHVWIFFFNIKRDPLSVSSSFFIIISSRFRETKGKRGGNGGRDFEGGDFV